MADGMVDDIQDDQDDQSETSNIEDRLKKLEESLTKTAKELEEERKASAGKDKKITELAKERKELQQTSYSKDKLLEIRERELEDKEQEFETRTAAERAELENLRRETLKHKVIAEIDNFPAALADRVRGDTEEEIKADALGLMRLFTKERDKVGNARKVGGRPQSGGGKQVSLTREDVLAMNGKDRMKWAATASDEEYAQIFDEIAQGD